MSSAKISALTAATSRVGLTLPAVQDGVNVRVSRELLDGVFRPEDYGALEYSASDTSTLSQEAAFQALATAVRAAGGGRIEFKPNVVYHVFDTGNSSRQLMNFDDCRGVIVNFNGSKLKTDNAFVSGFHRLICGDNVNGIEINDFWAEQTVTASLTTPSQSKGIFGINFGERSRGIKVRNARQIGGYAGFGISEHVDTTDTTRVTGDDRCKFIELDLHTTSVFYGAFFSYNGDRAYVRVRAERCARAYFPKNVSNHDFQIEASAFAGTSGSVEKFNFAVNADNTMDADWCAMRHMRGTVRFEDNGESQTVAAPISLTIQQETTTAAAATFEDIHISFDVEFDDQGTAVMETTVFDKSGVDGAIAVDSTGGRGHTFNDISFSGVLKTNTSSVNLALMWVDTHGAYNWTGSHIRNVRFHDITIGGTNGAGIFEIQGDVIEHGLVLENIYAPAATLTLNSPPANVLVARNVNFSNYALNGSATFNPASLADGAGETTTITVNGAELGDFAVASFSLTTSGITITAWVSATDTVSVRLQNESGGPLDIDSGTIRARVFPK